MQLIYYLISLKFSLVFFSVQVKYLILSIYIYYILGLGAGATKLVRLPSLVFIYIFFFK